MPSKRISARSGGALVALLLTSLALSGCEASLDVNFASSTFGDADEVRLALDGVDVLDEGSSEFELGSDADDVVDALDYTGGDTLELVKSGPLDEGRYTGIRLRFADSGSALYTSDGGVYPIDITSNYTYADMDVELDQDESDTRTIVFEPRFSLRPSTTADGHYSMTPVIRVVHPDRAGSISGTVDDDLVRSDTCRADRTVGTGVAVYAFTGANVTPQDYVSGEGGSPVAAADVQVSDDGDSFYYDFPLMAAGSYTLALTCNADVENPSTNDGFVFLTQASVVLDESESETVNLAE